MKGAITLGEGCVDNQPSRLANCSSIEMNTKIGENRRPSELLRLSFIESLGFFSLCHCIFTSYLFLLVCRCVLSVTPKSN
jgi:hypothetical protein